ncbi:MAG: tetratricopeptide repeat protein [bacterium]|nr:tetratricopeptide repeat protein [bacterium]
MKSILLRVIILIAILSSPTYFIYKDYLSNKDEGLDLPLKEDFLPSSTATPDKTDDKAIKINVVPIKDTVSPVKSALRGTIPNLDKQWLIPESYSADAKRIINERIAELMRDLKANPDQHDKWITLGNTRKLVGDHTEAVVIWEFVVLNWPDGLVAYHNLGDVYASYLNNKVKAEANMLKVVELDPHYISEYLSLYHLYLAKVEPSVEDKDKAVNILIKGLGSNPQAVDLMIAIAAHYRDMGDKENAKKYYEMALTEAKKLGNSKLQAAIESELANL